LSLKFIKKIEKSEVSSVLSEGYVLRVRMGKLAGMYTLVSIYVHTHIK